MIGSPSYSKRTSSSTKTWPRKNSEKSVCAKRLALWTLALCFSPLLVFIGQINAKQRSELFFNSHHGVSPSPRKEHCVSCPLLAVKYPRPRVLFWFEPPKQVGDVPSLLQQPVQDATSTPIEQPMLGVGQQRIHLVVGPRWNVLVELPISPPVVDQQVSAKDAFVWWQLHIPL